MTYTPLWTQSSSLGQHSNHRSCCWHPPPALAVFACRPAPGRTSWSPGLESRRWPWSSGSTLWMALVTSRSWPARPASPSRRHPRWCSTPSLVESSDRGHHQYSLCSWYAGAACYQQGFCNTAISILAIYRIRSCKYGVVGWAKVRFPWYMNLFRSKNWFNFCQS